MVGCSVKLPTVYFLTGCWCISLKVKANIFCTVIFCNNIELTFLWFLWSIFPLCISGAKMQFNTSNFLAFIFMSQRGQLDQIKAWNSQQQFEGPLPVCFNNSFQWYKPQFSMWFLYLGGQHGSILSSRIVLLNTHPMWRWNRIVFLSLWEINDHLNSWERGKTS